MTGSTICDHPFWCLKKAIGDYDSDTNSDVFYTTKQISWHQLSVLLLSSVLTLSTWRQCQIAEVEGAVL